MRLTFIFSILFLLLPASTSLSGQGQAKTISFKSGQVLDVIFLNNQAGGEEDRKAYFKEVVSTALAAGHEQMAVFGVSETPTAGNYHPEVAVLGTWPSLADRKHAMKALVEQFPDFHERRRKSWSTFNMTYYLTGSKRISLTRPILKNTTSSVCTGATMSRPPVSTCAI
ncbi:hypothetical protein CEQ90_08720 [Lewinellaceae bacterium SD302]|nr:hypothetical protein CEQ90_08720 [Lewinellaceae bacterium SD302]